MDKPKCNMGIGDNVFEILARVEKALRNERLFNQASECRNRVFSAGTYQEAIDIMKEYVEEV